MSGLVQEQQVCNVTGVVYINTGGEIASTFDNPSAVKLGGAKVIEEIMIGEDRLIHFSGVKLGEACTIVLRGASKPWPMVQSTLSMHVRSHASCVQASYIHVTCSCHHDLTHMPTN